MTSLPISRLNENLFCFTCKKTVKSEISFSIGLGVFLIDSLLIMVSFLFACFAYIFQDNTLACVLLSLLAVAAVGCLWIPFFLKDCKDIKHYCGSCYSVLGKKRFLVDNFCVT